METAGAKLRGDQSKLAFLNEYAADHEIPAVKQKASSNADVIDLISDSDSDEGTSKENKPNPRYDQCNLDRQLSTVSSSPFKSISIRVPCVQGDLSRCSQGSVIKIEVRFFILMSTEPRKQCDGSPCIDL